MTTAKRSIWCGERRASASTRSTMASPRSSATLPLSRARRDDLSAARNRGRKCSERAVNCKNVHCGGRILNVRGSSPGALDFDFVPPRRNTLRRFAPPLDERDRTAVERLLETELGQFARVFDAEEIDVLDRRIALVAMPEGKAWAAGSGRRHAVRARRRGQKRFCRSRAVR